jgi:hypothetical protein
VIQTKNNLLAQKRTSHLHSATKWDRFRLARYHSRTSYITLRSTQHYAQKIIKYAYLKQFIRKVFSQYQYNQALARITGVMKYFYG